MRASERARVPLLAHAHTQQLVALPPLSAGKPALSATAPPGRNVIRTHHRYSPERTPCQGSHEHYYSTLRNNQSSCARSPFTDHGSIETPDHSTSPMDRPSPGTNEGSGPKKRLSATHPIINRSLPRSAEGPAALTLDGAKILAPDSGAMAIKKTQKKPLPPAPRVHSHSTVDRQPDLGDNQNPPPPPLWPVPLNPPA